MAQELPTFDFDIEKVETYSDSLPGEERLPYLEYIWKQYLDKSDFLGKLGP